MKLTTGFWVGLATMALVLGMPVAGWGQVLLNVNNASFEDPSLPPDGFTTYGGPDNTIPDWMNPNIAGVQHMTSGDYSAIPDGVNAAFNDSSAPIYQNLVTTDATPAAITLQEGTYDLTVAVGWRDGRSFAGGSIELYTAGGTQLGSLTLTQPTVQGTFEDETLEVTISASDVNLGQQLQIDLRGTALGGATIDFDDVRLEFTAVPEPSTYALLGVTLLMLGIVNFRKAGARLLG